MSKLFLKRIIAYCIDQFIMVCYALLLFLISRMVFDLDNISSVKFSPVEGQILALISLTVPVFLYGFLMEKSDFHGTIGKRLCGIFVSSANNSDSGAKSIFIRNILKYLPWEIAHTGVHWLFYFNRTQTEIPLWVFVLLIMPQLMVFYYFVTAMISKGGQTFYDKLAKTKLELLVQVKVVKKTH